MSRPTPTTATDGKEWLAQLHRLQHDNRKIGRWADALLTRARSSRFARSSEPMCPKSKRGVATVARGARTGINCRQSTATGWLSKPASWRLFRGRQQTPSASVLGVPGYPGHVQHHATRRRLYTHDDVTTRPLTKRASA